MERRLAAVFAADVVGFSRLMGENEEETIAALKHRREHLFNPKITEYAGRVVDHAGDSTLAEFPSVVGAVRCALDIQENLKALNKNINESRRILFRIGINLGDIVVDSDAIYGDGVNVAARLETLAQPGGICLSRAARDQVRDKLDVSWEDLGEIEVKNIARPVRVFAVFAEGAPPRREPLSKTARRWPIAIAACALLIGALSSVAWWQPWISPSSPGQSEKSVYSLPDKPSIAVLAFDNLGEKVESVSLGDALSENLITELSRDGELFVIARHSSFSYKGKEINVRKVAEELGVRYLIEGSVQKAGNNARVTVQLIDALNGDHIWAERYDRSLNDLFKLQDEVASTVGAQVSSAVERSERKRAILKNPSNLAAFEYRMLALNEFFKWTKVGNIKSREFLLKALEKDPNYARAYAALVWVYLRGYHSGWLDLPREEALEKAREYGQKALELDPHDSFNHRAMAQVFVESRDLERSLSQLKEAIKANPNDDKAYVGIADPLVYLGRNQEAVEAVKLAMRLNPHHQAWYHWQLAWAQYHAEDYEAALATLEKMSNPPNKARRVWAAIYLRLGRPAEASAMIAEFVKNEPTFDIATEYRQSRHRDPKNKQRFIDDMRQLFPDVPVPK